MKKKRSIGVTILGYFMIIAPLRIYIDIFLLLLITRNSLVLLPKYILNYYLSDPLLLVFQTLAIILGVGILQLKKWALKYVLILNLIGALAGIISLLVLVPFPTSGKIYLIIISIFYLLFFMRNSVKEQFE